MAYSLETSSVKTIVPGAEVSGFCDVVARQKINEVSGEVPQFSAGEGIGISTVDGKTVITNNISAGDNISLVYDMETNTYRIDSTGGSTGEYVPLASSVVPYAGEVYKSNYDVSSVNYYESAHFSIIDTSNQITVMPYALEASGTYSSNGGYSKQHTSVKPRMIYTEQSANDGERFSIGIYHRERMDTDTSAEPYTYFGESYSSGTNYEGLMFDERRVKRTSISNNVTSTNSATWDQILNAATGSQGHTYTGVAPIQVNNTTDEISITGESLSAGPGINIFSSGGYVVISANGGGTTYTGDAQGALDEVYANSGVWLTSHQSLSNYVSKSDNSVAIGFQNNASYSFAQGEYCRAANYSFAQGTNNSADNDSFAQGYNNIATSYYTFAQGDGNRATGMYSFAQGKNNTAALQSFAQGFSNSAYDTSLAQGANNRAYNGSIAQGRNNYASNESQAFGDNTKATNNGMAIGTYNKTESAAFVVGNGTSNNKSDAFIVFHDGSVSAAGKISANGVELGAGGGSTFPITGTNGTTGFTANMDCSSMMLTTGASPAGGYVKQTVRGVQYEAYPATDVSASWYNIINGANNRSNCYCIRFTNDMTAASLEDYSAYDKVTVVHSNQYTPDCMLYWDGNTKVFPSGLYCELVKGVNDQNQTDWFFTTSGWINNLEWDWD